MKKNKMIASILAVAMVTTAASTAVFAAEVDTNLASQPPVEESLTSVEDIPAPSEESLTPVEDLPTPSEENQSEISVEEFQNRINMVKHIARSYTKGFVHNVEYVKALLARADVLVATNGNINAIEEWDGMYSVLGTIDTKLSYGQNVGYKNGDAFLDSMISGFTSDLQDFVEADILSQEQAAQIESMIQELKDFAKAPVLSIPPENLYRDGYFAVDSKVMSMINDITMAFWN